MVNVIVVPEPHIWDKSISAMVDYEQEIMGYMKQVERIVHKYDKPVVIFLGDIFHRSFKYYGKSKFWERYFYNMYLYTENNVYSVVGNHEFTYQKDNPFWYITKIESDFVKQRLWGKDQWASLDFIVVPDAIQIGSVMILFNHYGMLMSDIDIPDDVEDVIMISHNSLITKEVEVSLNETYKRKIETTYLKPVDVRSIGALPLTDKLRMVYVGHMHKAFGKYRVQESINGYEYDFVLRLLGSLGRTNATEYVDTDLDRVVPVIQIEDKIVGVTEESIRLFSRDSSVNEDMVIHAKEKYRGQQELRELRVIDLKVENTVSTLKDTLGSYPELMEILNSSLNGEFPIELKTVLED